MKSRVGSEFGTFSKSEPKHIVSAQQHSDIRPIVYICGPDSEISGDTVPLLFTHTLLHVLHPLNFLQKIHQQLIYPAFT